MSDDEIFKGTPGLWELLLSKSPNDNIYTRKNYDNYARLMLKTSALHRDNDPKSLYPKSSKSEKWISLLSPIWHDRFKYDGSGVVVFLSDPNALLERLDLLLSSKKAGHTNVGNELVSICDELKRQGVLDTRSYKKLNFFTRIFTSSAAKQIASSALDVGKSVAKEGAMKALDVGKMPL